MILLLCRLFAVMHLLLHLIHQPTLSSLSFNIKSVSAFPVFRVLSQRQRQQEQQHHSRQSLYNGRIQTEHTTSDIYRQRSMSRESSSLTTTENNNVDRNDITVSQRPIFDEKHVQKVLFVECGMYCITWLIDKYKIMKCS